MQGRSFPPRCTHRCRARVATEVSVPASAEQSLEPPSSGHRAAYRCSRAETWRLLQPSSRIRNALRSAWWSRPTRQTTLLNCVPLSGSEPDAKVETLSTKHMLHVCLEVSQGAIDQTAVLPSCLLLPPVAGPARTLFDSSNDQVRRRTRTTMKIHWKIIYCGLEDFFSLFSFSLFPSK